jgi:hypothetical protein
MRRAVTFVLLAASLLAPGTARAGETQVSTDPSAGLLAQGDWLSWVTNGGSERVLWHRGTRTVFSPSDASPIAFGTDVRSREVAVYTSCESWTVAEGSRGCSGIESRLGAGTRRTLVRRHERGLLIFDEDRGSIVYTLRPPSFFQSPIYMRLAHHRGKRRVVVANPEGLALSHARVAFLDLDSDWERVRVVDYLGAARTLDTRDASHDDCRCTSDQYSFGHVRIEGRYAYWMWNTFHGMPGSWAGSEVRRANLFQSRPKIFAVSLEHQPTSLDVHGGRLVYSSAEGVYEIAEPAWRSTGRRIPG